jgi:hypothetical protein
MEGGVTKSSETSGATDARGQRRGKRMKFMRRKSSGYDDNLAALQALDEFGY